MAPQVLSAATVGNAARALEAACERLCADEIGKALQRLYDGTAREPVPDAMRDLLRRLK